MTTLERICELEQKLIAGNIQLLKQLPTLKPEDQKFFAEKVYRSIERTQEIVSDINKKVLLQTGQL